MGIPPVLASAAAGLKAAAGAGAAAAGLKAAAAAPALASGIGALAPAAAGAAAAAPALASGIGAAAAPALAAKVAGMGIPAAAAALPGAAMGIPTAAGLPGAIAGKAAAMGAAAPSAVPLAATLKATTPIAAAPSAVPPITQGLGSMVPAPAGANLAGNLAATDSMVKAGAQGAMQAGANSSQAAQMGQRLQRLGRALAGSGQGGAAPVQPAKHEVSRGNRQPQSGGPMNTLPQQTAESPGMQLFNSAPPMGGGMMPMNPMPMSPVQPLSGNMYEQPKIDLPPMRMMRDGGYIEGPGTGRSDSIPARIYQDGRPVQEARLSDGEFVMTERAVRGAGNGDRAQGAARMYRMMREFEKGGRVHGRA